MPLLEPQFFDILGAAGFIYVIAVSLFLLFKKKLLPKWVTIILFLVGSIGFLVDISIVYAFFLK